MQPQAWYTTRGRVLASFEVAETTRIAPLIDAEIQAASESVDHQLHRHFTVWHGTRVFDWPNRSSAPMWTLYLDDYSLLSLSSVTSGGEAIDTADVILYNSNGLQHPPYERIELDLSTSAAFSAGATSQQSLLIEGLWGYTDATSIAGTLVTGVNASASVLNIDPVSNRSLVDVGSAIIIGDERMMVTERAYNDAGTVLLNDLEAKAASNTIQIADTSKLSLFDRLSIEGEFMDILSITGTYVTVKRATNGSVLAAHNGGASIFVPNTYSVLRGHFGTTATAHSSAVTVTVQRYPAQVEQLALAETVVAVAQNAGLYARVVGQGGSTREAVGKGLDDMRRAAYQSYGRKLRKSAI